MLVQTTQRPLIDITSRQPCLNAIAAELDECSHAFLGYYAPRVCQRPSLKSKKPSQQRQERTESP
jgi:hypothetical protein